MLRRRLQAEEGQALVETAIILPLLFLLLAGVVLAALAVYRSTAADWGVFIYATGAGSFQAPATAPAAASVPWADLRAGLSQAPAERRVRSQIQVEWSRPWLLGAELGERQTGGALMRRWRFYPGRPTGPWE